MGNEAELMRDCAPLYTSIALESFSTFLMGLTFLYLLLLITNKGRLQKPGQAFRKFVVAELSGFMKDLYDQVSHWADMPKLPLSQRFATCRKMNQAICSFQLVLAALTISRWLHIGNVNGFRYLGYAVTCPPMQAELLMLIAPIVPFYRFNIIFTYIITTIMEISAWGGSLTEGELFGNMDEAFASGDVHVLVPQKKFYAILPGVTILCFLLFIQIPYLQVLFCCKREKLEELGCPPGYLKLLVICQVTWVAFPAWWLLGFEGLAIIEDTKANAVGFALLNVISKATFSVHMIGISGKYRKLEHAKQRALQRSDSLGSNHSGSSDEDSGASAAKAEPRQDNGMESWFVRILRPYDAQLAMPEKWHKLDSDFRAFLMGSGLTPHQYDDMSFSEKQVYHSRFSQMSEGVYVGNRPPATPSNNAAGTAMSVAQCDAEMEKKVSQALSDGGLMPTFSPSISEARSPRKIITILEEEARQRAQNQHTSCAEIGGVLMSPRLSEASPPARTEVVAAKEYHMHDSPRVKPVGDTNENVQQQLQDLLEAMQQGQDQQKENEGNSFSSIVCCTDGVKQSIKSRTKGCVPVRAGQPTSSPPPPAPKAVAEKDQEGLQGLDLMLGQMVTTAQGTTGRICQRTGDSIKVITSTGAVERISMSQVTVLIVTVIGAKNLHQQLPSYDLGHARAFCTCEVIGKPSSKTKTKPALVAPDVNWKHEAKLLGYAPGDSLQISVVSEAGIGNAEERYLGNGVLSADSFSNAGFEGEVQLMDSHGLFSGATVTVLVMPIQAAPHSNGHR
mmetsp:Transcript_58342/g.139082  ORF Transcript_58342/g.139082 Transcript_58342/m.139082 type:complete len:789 (-) Transcript_58342:205-2571(-)